MAHIRTLLSLARSPCVHSGQCESYFRSSKVDEKYIDQTMEHTLRTKFSLGLFESAYVYLTLLKIERETIVY